MTEVADGVHVSGALGRAPTDTYKISATYLDGYKVGGFAQFGTNIRHEGILILLTEGTSP